MTCINTDDDDDDDDYYDDNDDDDDYYDDNDDDDNDDDDDYYYYDAGDGDDNDDDGDDDDDDNDDDDDCSRPLVPSFAGFDAVTLANNHFNDFGSKGVSFTVEILKKTGIRHFGDSYGKWDTSQVT